MIEAFLNEYAKYLEWPERGFDAVARKLCEEYHYSPNNATGDGFLKIAMGWMWGKSIEEMPHIQATCESTLLKLKLDKMYTIVAQENDWD